MRKLIWKQDFLSSDADLSEWNIRIGNDLLDDNDNPICPGWGNNEQQYYTSNSSNLYFDKHGLNICARHETIEHDNRTFAYTSARLDTKDHLAFCYGKLVVRAKLPIGQGLWPAIWLLPQEQAYGPWPASGEIDIMEAKGRLPNQIFSTLHHGKDWDNKIMNEFSYQFESSTINEFHDYELEWNSSSIRWSVDGHCYAEQVLQPTMKPFDKKFYLVLNLAIGGWFDNVSIDEAALPAVMTISNIGLYE